MPIQIKAGQTLKHECGLEYKHPGPMTLELKTGDCPQCHNPVLSSHISGGIPQLVTWRLIPPHGTSFKNEMGAEVTIKFPQGGEVEMFQTLQLQLQQQFAASQPRAPRAPPAYPSLTPGVIPSRMPPDAPPPKVTSLTLDPDTGELIQRNPNE